MLFISLLLMGYSTAKPMSAQEKIQSAPNLIDKAGLKQGYWVIEKNGIVIEEGEYKNNRKEGIWKSYYNNQKVRNEISYSNGEAKGYAKMYYKNGKVREEGNWQVDHWEGNYKYYFESGKLSYDWFYNENGKREGEQRYFYTNGEKMYEGNWENGKTEGILKVYNDSGVLIQEKVFNKGQFAEIKDHLPNDKISSKNQKFTGTGFHTVINLMGKVDEKGFFVKGELYNGEKYSYDERGRIISIATYENGKAVNHKQITSPTEN